MNSIPKMGRFDPIRAACSGACQKGWIDTPHFWVLMIPSNVEACPLFHYRATRMGVSRSPIPVPTGRRMSGHSEATTILTSETCNCAVLTWRTDPMSDGEEAGLEAGFDMQFGQQPDNVRPGSPGTDRQTLRDCPVVAALRQQGQDFALSWRELLQPQLHLLGALSLGACAAKKRDDVLRWLSELAGAHTSNHLHDLRGVG